MDLLETMFSGQPLTVVQRGELIALLHMIEVFAEVEVTKEQSMECWLRIRRQYLEWVKTMEHA